MIVRSRKSLIQQFISLVLVLFVVVGALAEVTQYVLAAAPPQIIAYQGRVLNAHGVPVSDATASMMFELYTDASTGTCVWSNSSSTCAGTHSATTQRTVELADGLFSENLGDTNAAVPYASIPSSVFADNATLYLQVYIDGETLLPRKQVVSTPFSINSSLLDGLDTTSTGSTSAAVPIFDSTGNLKVTGSPSGSAITSAVLSVNPASGSLDNSIFGVGVAGVLKFLVDNEGDTTIGGSLTVNGGAINSPVGITLTSSGGDIAINPSSGIAYVTAGDNFAVGGTSLISPFSVNASGNIVRIGDGVDNANDPNILFYASDAADFGKLAFSDDDAFVFSEANINFAGGQVQVDDDVTPNIPGAATGAGDLYIADALEADGSVIFGDTTGIDTITFTSAATTQDAATFTLNSLTTGQGLYIERAAGGADVDGSMMRISQSNNSVTSDAVGLFIENQAGGAAAAGLYISQEGGHNGIVLDIGEVGSTDNAIYVRSNVLGIADTEFRVTSQGDAFVDNAFTGGGADLAEFFVTSDQSLAGYDVVCQDQIADNRVRKCAPGERDVLGVISTNPAFIGNNISDGTTDIRNDPRYRLVGLLGQVETRVNADEGAISVGDPLTASGTLAGYAAKATSSTRIIGYALDSLGSGTGVITVFVSPQWYGGDLLAQDGGAVVARGDLVLAAEGIATASANFSSGDLLLRGSRWNGASADTADMALRTVIGETTANYRLSVVNDDGAEVAYISASGDFALAGLLYPSDRGMLQTEKYITYDGSAGPGGDVMRTNASGWATGSYDFAEMFPSRDPLAAGEVVIFSDNDEEVRRSTTTTYDDRIAGVVSTKPGFLAGENLPGHVPVALAGRVPTYVSGENGAIAIGDPLTTSTKPGYAMKATEPGPVVGYAMEAFNGNTGVVSVFVRPSYYDGGPVDDSPVTDNPISQLANVTSLSVSSLSVNGGAILSIGSLSGIGQIWRLEEDGDFITHGRVIHLVRSYMNEDVETTPALSRETTIQLSGTVRLHDGVAVVQFDQFDSQFNDIISNEVSYRVYLTPAGMTGMLYVVNRDQNGFMIRESGSATSGVDVDWLVIAYHKDFAPQTPSADVSVSAEVPTQMTDEQDDVPTVEDVIEPDAVPFAVDVSEQVGTPTEVAQDVVHEEVVVEEDATIQETRDQAPVEESQVSGDTSQAQEDASAVEWGSDDSVVE